MGMVIIIWIGIILLAVTCGQNIPAAEIDALHDLYDATNGTNWSWDTIQSFGVAWNFSGNPNPCADPWIGIICVCEASTGNCNVDNITLSDGNLIGWLPSSISALTNLTVLALRYNNLTSTIPSSVSQLMHLQYLLLEGNSLTGPIPSELGSLVDLSVLELAENHFRGSIPLTLAALSNITEILLFENDLTGTIPDIFENMPLLSVFAISDNTMHGTLPYSLFNLPSIEFVVVQYNELTGTLPSIDRTDSNFISLEALRNHLTGTIPMTYFTNAKLRTLEVGYNALEGTLPDDLGGNTQLLYLKLTFNLLSGPLPSALGAQPGLYVLDVDNNYFTGTIPEGVYDLYDMQYIDMGLNRLHGSISDRLRDMPYLYAVNFEGNHFTGTFPSGLTELPYMTYISLYDNQLHGTLPAALGSLYYLEYLYVDVNHFTGTVPPELGNPYYLVVLDLDTNLLTGTFPDQLCNLYYLRQFGANNNLLTGSLPANLPNLESLVVLLLLNNKLTGSLDGAFNGSTQLYLTNIDLNNNRFTGTLPHALFELPSLQTLTAVGNCLHGELPDTICQARTLNALALDGLSSAASCRTKILPDLSDSYAVTKALTGTVPACLFDMPILTTLHLSGNGLTGTLPDEIGAYSLLSDLSLSHNLLTGTIPVAIQRRRWYSLDLSFNRLGGTLLSDFASEPMPAEYFVALSLLLGRNLTAANAQSTTSLENNRLSGRIPSVLQTAQNISMLGTNIFSCNDASTNLPQHDDDRKNYQCGSASFNAPFYLWLAAAVLVAVAVTTFRVWGAVWVATMERWNVAMQRATAAIRAIVVLCENLVRLAAMYAVVALFVLLPLYVLASTYAGVVVHSYAYAVSAAYLSGVWVAGTEFVVLVVLLLALIYGFHQLAPNSITDGHASTAGAGEKHRSLPAWRTAAVYAAFIAINLFFVVTVNAAYVYFAVYGNSDALLAWQVLLSLFKLVWNRFFSIYAIRWASQLGMAADPTGDSETTAVMQSKYATLQVFMALLNNIAVPCLVVAVVSPNCFYNVFVAPPEVTTVIVFDFCIQLNGGSGCQTFYGALNTISYEPPFTYNYQCSSSFITYYAPAFVILCIVRTFLTPLLQGSLFWLYQRATPGTRWHAALELVQLPILKSVDASKAPPVQSIYQPYFDANQLLLSLITYFGLLLTFGAVFPPLAVCIVLTMFSVVAVNNLKVGRFLSIAEALRLPAYVRVMEEECKMAGFDRILLRAMWMLVTASCWFYTLFLFDTLGDAVGFERAYWVLIVMPLMPAVLYASTQLLQGLLNQKSSVVQGSVDCEQGAELQVQVLSRNAEVFNVVHSDGIPTGI
jgi:Leucine-rich repeat (LRR) protein